MNCRRILIALLLLFPCLASAAPPAGAGWNVVWSDEFAGSSLDLSKWQHHLTGPRRQATNTPGAVAVGGGNLTITTFTKGGTHFTGMVASAETFLYAYGYIEARINFDTSPGMWSAFWMQSPTMGDASIYTTDPNLAGTEIDICEHRFVDSSSSNIAAKIVGNLHWGGYGADHKSTGYTSPDLDLGGGYHIYGMEWSPTQQKFYIDGVLRWTVDNGSNSPVSNRSEYLWLSSEVQSDASVDWAGPIPAAGYGAFDTSTTKMRVDYVRVYQPAETVANADFAGRLAPFDPTNQATSSSTGGRTSARAGKLAPTTSAGASLRQTLQRPHARHRLHAQRLGKCGNHESVAFHGRGRPRFSVHGADADHQRLRAGDGAIHHRGGESFRDRRGALEQFRFGGVCG